MKYLISIVMLFSSTVFAGGFEARMMQMSRISDADIYQVGEWRGVQVSYVSDGGLYVFGADENVGVYPKGKSHEYNIQGIGVGVKHSPLHNINVFGQIGVHRLSSTWGERERRHNEALDYYLNSRWAEWLPNNQTPHTFNELGVIHDKYTSSIEVGLELMYPLSKEWSAGFVASYRGMKIKETLRGYKDEWNYDKTRECWEMGAMRDYSSLNTGLTLIYEW